MLQFKEKIEEIWLSPMTKAHTPTEMSKGQSDNTNNATKKFDYTAVVDRLRTVSWSNYDHPSRVVNLVYGPNQMRHNHIEETWILLFLYYTKECQYGTILTTDTQLVGWAYWGHLTIRHKYIWKTSTQSLNTSKASCSQTLLDSL